MRNTKESMAIWGVFGPESNVRVKGSNQWPDNRSKVSVIFYGKRDSEGKPKNLTGAISFDNHKWHPEESYFYKKWFKLRLWRHGLIGESK
ncbi:MAG: hypothetical protein IMZ47_04255 [Firmicutes bacterium]|nr:hypothetical protein [Bacillota bacterium]